MRRSVRKEKAAIQSTRSVRRRIPALEWLDEVSGSSARATMIGNRRVLIENHTGILEFAAECVRLSSKRGEITVSGTELTLAEVRPHSLIVLGRIDAVEMPPEGKDALD